MSTIRIVGARTRRRARIVAATMALPWLVAAASALALARPARGQLQASPHLARDHRPAAEAAPRLTGTIRGVVVDSLNGGPFVGAHVLIDSMPVTARTDSNGTFHMLGVPAGRRTIALSGPVLDSIGLSLPTATVQLEAGATLEIMLGVPSATTLAHAVCPTPAGGTERGAIVGRVRDVDADTALSGAVVTATWSDWRVGTGGIGPVPRERSARSGEAGWYRICGLPAGTVLLGGAVGGGAVAHIDADLRGGPFAYRDIRLAARSGPVRGAAPDSGGAVLDLVVRNERGEALDGAAVTLAASRARGSTDGAGRLRLAGLPGGTQLLEVQRAGYEAGKHVVQLRTGAPTPGAVVLHRTPVQLELVRVEATRRSETLREFDARQRRGVGQFLGEAELKRAGTLRTDRLLLSLPGIVRLTERTGATTFGSFRRGASAIPFCFLLDGQEVSGDLVAAVPTPEIQAIEIYREAVTVPLTFKVHRAACPGGAIAVWTRRR